MTAMLVARPWTQAAKRAEADRAGARCDALAETACLSPLCRVYALRCQAYTAGDHAVHEGLLDAARSIPVDHAYTPDVAR